MRTYSPHAEDEVDDILVSTHSAFVLWRETPFSLRSGLMREAGSVLRQRREELAHLMVMEMGKPVAQAVGEVDKCAWVCDAHLNDERQGHESLHVFFSLCEVCFLSWISSRLPARLSLNYFFLASLRITRSSE